VQAAADFFASVIERRSRARLTWTWGAGGRPGAPFIEVSCDRMIKSVELVTACAPTRDFRKAHWSVASGSASFLSPLAGSEGKSDPAYGATIDATVPATGWIAAFARATIVDGDGREETYCTEIRMFGKDAPPRRARF
ncbi:MAG: hypothetical protein ACRELB_13775, partial [Polyangiaceae bacterium]